MSTGFALIFGLFALIQQLSGQKLPSSPTEYLTLVKCNFVIFGEFDYESAQAACEARNASLGFFTNPSEEHAVRQKIDWELTPGFQLGNYWIGQLWLGMKSSSNSPSGWIFDNPILPGFPVHDTNFVNGSHQRILHAHRRSGRGGDDDGMQKLLPFLMLMMMMDGHHNNSKGNGTKWPMMGNGTMNGDRNNREGGHGDGNDLMAMLMGGMMGGGGEGGMRGGMGSMGGGPMGDRTRGRDHGNRPMGGMVRDRIRQAIPEDVFRPKKGDCVVMRKAGWVRYNCKGAVDNSNKTYLAGALCTVPTRFPAEDKMASYSQNYCGTFLVPPSSSAISFPMVIKKNYFLFKGEFTYDEAVAQCAAEHGQLATSRSEEEYLFITKYLDFTLVDNKAWVGLKRAPGSNNDFAWIDGLPNTYIDAFLPGEPSQAGDCIMYVDDGAGTMKWKADGCDQKMSAICEHFSIP